jgi:hypothetical protein
MRTQLACAAVLGWFSLTDAALAADNGRFWNFNDTSCGQFIDDRKTNMDAPDRLWLAGWLSAYNALMPHTFNILGSDDLAGAMLWIENWCRQNPLKGMPEAAWALTMALYPTRQTVAPK